MRTLSDLGMFIRYARGLRTYLGHPLDREGCRRLLERQIAERERTFLRVLERGVYEIEASPYRRLLEHAGVELGDVRGMVADAGLEGALTRLYEAGVYVNLEEVKGRAPIRRSGLELTTAERDFDNPLLAGRYAARSGGSRSAGRRTIVDLGGIGSENAHWPVFDEAFGVVDAPTAIWVPAPPGYGGLWNVLARAGRGLPTERWFSQTAPPRLRTGPRDALVTHATVAAIRRHGPGLERPSTCRPRRLAWSRGGSPTRWPRARPGTSSPIQAPPFVSADPRRTRLSTSPAP